LDHRLSVLFVSSTLTRFWEPPIFFMYCFALSLSGHNAPPISLSDTVSMYFPLSTRRVDGRGGWNKGNSGERGITYPLGGSATSEGMLRLHGRGIARRKADPRHRVLSTAGCVSSLSPRLGCLTSASHMVRPRSRICLLIFSSVWARVESFSSLCLFSQDLAESRPRWAGRDGARLPRVRGPSRSATWP